MKKRLFVVSNRLPLTVEQTEHGYSCRQSSGGLISSVNAYLKNDGADSFSQTFWVGAPGCNQRAWEAISGAATQSEFSYVPIFINKKKYEAYYNGFSNSLIWPLFHYFPSYAEYNDSHFEPYIEVNKQFAVEMLRVVRKDDVVWIHDYHLMPLAGMLRENMPSLTIGFFLHIPFPSYELFRVIPKRWQREILTGMLGADLIGFHTIDYAEHFHESVSKIMKAERDTQFISWNNRQVKADAFPISIDFSHFNNAYGHSGVAAQRQKFIEMKGDKKLIFSIDRLDYTKGLSNRLKGFEQFLVKHPEYKEKVVFALTLIPSRDGIIKYAERKRIIDEQIGSLNSRLGTITWQPVIYHYNHLSFEELAGLYTACDMALITPLRDGMNLVSKEFVASRKDKRGVLILSEMAGSANELSEALLINPNDSGEIADMIKLGLEMGEEEQMQRLEIMQQKISTYNVNTWASDFFKQLASVKAMQLEFAVKFLDDTTKIELLDTYSKAIKRLFLLDYDGSLTPLTKHPSMATPDESLLKTLAYLAQTGNNDVFIISGRDSATLEKWFGHLPVGLIAEHGAKVRFKEGDWLIESGTDTHNWMDDITRIMNRYVVKCANSFIETKEFSVAWHYRNAERKEADIRAQELSNELKKESENLSLNVLNGHKVIEVRNRNVNKGLAAQKILHHGIYDFIFCIGDDVTDEDMFVKLARLPQAFSIKIGAEASFAKYNLYTPAMAVALLQVIAAYNNKELAN